MVLSEVIRKRRGCKDVLDDATCSGGGVDFGFPVYYCF
jgi:hypothetical protein